MLREDESCARPCLVVHSGSSKLPFSPFHRGDAALIQNDESLSLPSNRSLCGRSFVAAVSLLMLLNIRHLQDPLSPHGLHLCTCSVLCCVCCFFWTLTAFIYAYFMCGAFLHAAPQYILAPPGRCVFLQNSLHMMERTAADCVFSEHLEMQHMIIKAASKFQDNQPSNSGNLTRLGWHITLMNGTCLVNQHRAGALHLLFRLLEYCWWNLWQ